MSSSVWAAACDEGRQRGREAVPVPPQGAVVALDGERAHRLRRGYGGQAPQNRQHHTLVLRDLEDLRRDERQRVFRDVRVHPPGQGEPRRRAPGPHLGDPAAPERVDDTLDTGTDTARVGVSAFGEVAGPGVGGGLCGLLIAGRELLHPPSRSGEGWAMSSRRWRTAGA
ncbi:hypothetical protein ACIRLA_03690 [Streptomyces sp. NPDC102364]|uniref:hypothetical protein n=1 Tax=Streptomyces sp. NPDC102364 TaxID=3366161 RepID=UPI003814D8DF